GQRVQDKENCGGIVIDDYSCFTAKQLTKRLVNVRIPFTALTFLDVEFKIRVSGRNVTQVIDCTFGKNGPAQIRVQHDAGSVDDATQRRLEDLADSACDFLSNL